MLLYLPICTTGRSKDGLGIDYNPVAEMLVFHNQCSLVKKKHQIIETRTINFFLITEYLKIPWIW